MPSDPPLDRFRTYTANGLYRCSLCLCLWPQEKLDKNGECPQCVNPPDDEDDDD